MPDANGFPEFLLSESQLFRLAETSSPHPRRSTKAFGTLNDPCLFQMLRKSVFSTSGKGFSQPSLTVGLNDNGRLKNSCKILQLEDHVLSCSCESYDANVVTLTLSFKFPLKRFSWAGSMNSVGIRMTERGYAAHGCVIKL
jgi:hypothetical protein